jgi:hypothetical protein
MRPLEGIRVIDLTRVVSGPYCTMLLGDLGAEVIKVERPGEGDDTRAFAPPFTLDLKNNLGKELLWGLIERSDVLVENFRPAVERLGFGYVGDRRTPPSWRTACAWWVYLNESVTSAVGRYCCRSPPRKRTTGDHGLIYKGWQLFLAAVGSSSGRLPSPCHNNKSPATPLEVRWSSSAMSSRAWADPVRRSSRFCGAQDP